MNVGRVAARLLVVDSDLDAATALSASLAGEGFSTVAEHTADAGLRRATTEWFDLVLLDVMLPDRDGLDVLRTLRHQGVRTRVLVISCRNSIADRVSGLNAGADDYLVKPFDFSELVARARALLRRSPFRA